MLKGWKLEGDNTMGLRLSKGNKSVSFDLPVMHAKRRNPQTDSTEHSEFRFIQKFIRGISV